MLSYNGTEKRRCQRRLTYVGEGLDITLFLGDLKFQGHIIDLSIEGLGVIVPAGELTRSLTSFATSLIIQVEINSAQVSKGLRNAKVVSLTSFHRLGQEYVRFGLHLLNQRSTHFSSNERRLRRFETLTLRPQAYFRHPLFFKDTIHLDVVEISAVGITCLTSITNTTLIPNLIVPLKIYLPAKGEIEVQARVVTAKIIEAQIRVGFQILTSIDEFGQMAAEVVLSNDPDVTIADLRSEGFPIESLRDSIKFRFAEPSEREMIYNFRYETLQQDDWIKAPASLTDVQEEHDEYSRHQLAFAHGKLISVSRLIFNNGVRERSEHAQYDVKIPDWLWERGFVEAGRLLTHRDFRGAQVFLQMLQFVGLAAVGVGYRYAVLSSSTDLERVYLRVGCKLIDRFTIPGENTQWSLYYMDMQKCVKGQHSGPIAWWFFHRPLLKIGILKGWVQLNWFDKARLFLYRLVGQSAAKLMKK